MDAVLSTVFEVVESADRAITGPLELVFDPLTPPMAQFGHADRHPGARAPRSRVRRLPGGGTPLCGDAARDLHFFLKRAKTDAHLYGSAREHRDRVADLLQLSAASPGG